MKRWCLACALWLSGLALASDPVYVGLDAEFGHKTSTSAQAIQQGIEIAIEEINQAGGVLGGRPLKLITRDNRSVTAIGLDNLRELAQINDLVAVFGGKFSPIYIESLPLVHELGLPLLDPWGSADGITDHQYRPSFTFRLSIKDEWASSAMIRFAMQHHKVSRLGVLLPNTAWGRSNKAALDRASTNGQVSIVAQRWYNWGDNSLLDDYLSLKAAGAQAILLIANEVEGAVLVRDIASLPAAQRLPVVSHWGVTGGEFARLSGAALNNVDFAVIQSFSFVGLESAVGRRVLAALTRRGVPSAQDVKSPVGIAHAYDLTHLLSMAIQKAGSTDRRRVRDALEQLGPYNGLVRSYPVPFTRNRHDALTASNIFFARYTTADQLIPIDPIARR